MKITILRQEEIKKSATMVQAIEAVKKAYIQLSQGYANIPLRTQIPVEKHQGDVFFMPAFLASSESLGCKIASIFPKNLENNLPTIHAVVIVVDATTGRPEAMMDGTFLTALRTGAASGVATDLLARKDAHTAAIFGAGTQGRTQLEAICTVRPIGKVWIYDINPNAAEIFMKEMREKGKPIPSDIVTAESADQAIYDADVICTATTSSTPVFDNTHLKRGVHINGIGSYTPEMQEIPAETVLRSKVVVDSFNASLKEAGDLIIPLKEGKISKSHIYGEIGQIASGQIPGRESDEELTLFKSVGLAVQDMAVAKILISMAEKLNLGTYVEL